MPTTTTKLSKNKTSRPHCAATCVKHTTQSSRPVNLSWTEVHCGIPQRASTHATVCNPAFPLLPHRGPGATSQVIPFKTGNSSEERTRERNGKNSGQFHERFGGNRSRTKWDRPLNCVDISRILNERQGPYKWLGNWGSCFLSGC